MASPEKRGRALHWTFGDGASAVMSEADRMTTSCYQASVAREPQSAGQLEYWTKINAEGEVFEVCVAGEPGLATSAVDCVSDGLSRLKFPPPWGGAATLRGRRRLAPGGAPAAEVAPDGPLPSRH